MTEQIKKVPAEAGITEPAPLENPVLISDLHLTTKKPATIMGFFRFMKDVAPHYSELVILGDLFDFWIGDDARAAAEPIIAQLKLYSSLGHRLLIMPGNRDVMLGEDFARACGAELLAPQVKVNIKGRDVLLSHGDEWCLRDKEYQAFRAMVRNPQWQRMALSKSVAERMAMATNARSQSEGDKTVKTEAEMDVVESAVAESARAFGVDCVIHGHTHKPMAHVAGAIERWVIPDWELDDAKGGGRSGCITFLENGRPQIKTF